MLLVSFLCNCFSLNKKDVKSAFWRYVGFDVSSTVEAFAWFSFLLRPFSLLPFISFRHFACQGPLAVYKTKPAAGLKPSKNKMFRHLG